MSYTSNSEPLTNQDIDVIKSKYSKMRLVLIIMIFAFGGIGFFAYYLMDEIIPLFVVGFFDFLIFLGIWYFNHLAKKDINSGTKQIITGTIDQKKMKTSNTSNASGSYNHSSSSSTTSYYFIFDELEILIDQRDYDNHHAGQKVQIALTNSSKMVLGIKLLEDTPEQVKVQPHPNNIGFQTFMDEFNTVSMTEDEQAFIVKKRNKRLIYVTLWSTALGFLSYWIVLLAAILIMTGNVKDITPYLIQTIRYSLIGLIILIIAIIYYKRAIPLVRDCRENNKTLQRGVISDKIQSNARLLNKTWRVTSSRGDFYYLVINKKYIQVDPMAFQSMNQGDEVSIHRAFYSKTLLCIENKHDRNIRISMIN
jgi:hypothetical protein